MTRDDKGAWMRLLFAQFVILVVAFMGFAGWAVSQHNQIRVLCATASDMHQLREDLRDASRRMDELLLELRRDN